MYNTHLISCVSKFEVDNFLELRAHLPAVYLQALYTICYCFLPIEEYLFASDEIKGLSNALNSSTT